MPHINTRPSLLTISPQSQPYQGAHPHSADPSIPLSVSAPRMTDFQDPYHLPRSAVPRSEADRDRSVRSVARPHTSSSSLISHKAPAFQGLTKSFRSRKQVRPATADAVPMRSMPCSDMAPDSENTDSYLPYLIERPQPLRLRSNPSASLVLDAVASSRHQLPESLPASVELPQTSFNQTTSQSPTRSRFAFAKLKAALRPSSQKVSPKHVDVTPVVMAPADDGRLLQSLFKPRAESTEVADRMLFTEGGPPDASMPQDASTSKSATRADWGMLSYQSNTQLSSVALSECISHRDSPSLSPSPSRSCSDLSRADTPSLETEVIPSRTLGRQSRMSKFLGNARGLGSETRGTLAHATSLPWLNSDCHHSQTRDSDLSQRSLPRSPVTSGHKEGLASTLEAPRHTKASSTLAVKREETYTKQAWSSHSSPSPKLHCLTVRQPVPSPTSSCSSFHPEIKTPDASEMQRMLEGSRPSFATDGDSQVCTSDSSFCWSSRASTPSVFVRAIGGDSFTSTQCTDIPHSTSRQSVRSTPSSLHTLCTLNDEPSREASPIPELNGHLSDPSLVDACIRRARVIRPTHLLSVTPARNDAPAPNDARLAVVHLRQRPLDAGKWKVRDCLPPQPSCRRDDVPLESTTGSPAESIAAQVPISNRIGTGGEDEAVKDAMYHEHSPPTPTQPSPPGPTNCGEENVAAGVLGLDFELVPEVIEYADASHATIRDDRGSGMLLRWKLIVRHRSSGVGKLVRTVQGVSALPSVPGQAFDPSKAGPSLHEHTSETAKSATANHHSHFNNKGVQSSWEAGDDQLLSAKGNLGTSVAALHRDQDEIPTVRPTLETERTTAKGFSPRPLLLSMGRSRSSTLVTSSNDSCSSRSSELSYRKSLRSVGELGGLPPFSELSWDPCAVIPSS